MRPTLDEALEYVVDDELVEVIICVCSAQFSWRFGIIIVGTRVLPNSALCMFLIC